MQYPVIPPIVTHAEHPQRAFWAVADGPAPHPENHNLVGRVGRSALGAYAALRQPSQRITALAAVP